LYAHAGPSTAAASVPDGTGAPFTEAFGLATTWLTVVCTGAAELEEMPVPRATISSSKVK